LVWALSTKGKMRQGKVKRCIRRRGAAMEKGEGGKRGIRSGFCSH